MSPIRSQRDSDDLTRYGDWVKSSSHSGEEKKKQHLSLEDIDDSYGEVRISQEEETQLENLDSSLFESSGPPPTAAAEPTEEELDVTEQQVRMFQRIEEEIGTLHDEIRHLKGELHYFQNKVSAPAAAPDPQNSSGFFEEDMDETIALTGDELDNIFEKDDVAEEALGTDPLDDLDIASVIAETEERPASVSDDPSPEDEFESISDFENFDVDSPAFDSSSAPEVLSDDIESDDLEKDTLLSSANIETANSGPDPFEDAVFDDGEEVSIDLNTDDSELSSKEGADAKSDISIEEMSLEDFGLSDETEKAAPVPPEEPQHEPDPLEEMANSSTGGIFATETEAFPEEEDVDLEALDIMVEPPEEAAAPVEDFTGPSFEILDESPSEENVVDPAPPEEESDKAEPEAENTDDNDDDNDFHVPLDEFDVSEFDVDEFDAPPEKNEETAVLSSSEEESPALPLQDEVRDILKYMDKLLDALPDEKIREFARSEHFETYKKIFEELGIND